MGEWMKIKIKNYMKRIYGLIAAVVISAAAMAQSDPLANGIAAVADVVGETKTADDVAAVVKPVEEEPLWKQKLYYGYNFDIYYHHDSKPGTKENGWSIALTPEIGWKLKERLYLGLRLGGSYSDTYTTNSILDELSGKNYTEDLRVIQGTWEVAPYARYRLKTLFNDKVGIWLEAHLYAGMNFPRVTDGKIAGTDYDGLRYSATYGLQVSPVITYQFSKKRTLQVFFSIMSIGYSGTTRFYADTAPGGQHNEYSNDIIIFSGKLRNLIANQFTPGLYGLKFGVQKSF